MLLANQSTGLYVPFSAPHSSSLQFRCLLMQLFPWTLGSRINNAPAIRKLHITNFYGCSEWRRRIQLLFMIKRIIIGNDATGKNGGSLASPLEEDCGDTGKPHRSHSCPSSTSPPPQWRVTLSFLNVTLMERTTSREELSAWSNKSHLLQKYTHGGVQGQDNNIMSGHN